MNLWATAGGVVLLFAVYAYTRWIISADFATPDPGSDHYPYLLWLRTVEVLSVLAVMGFLWLKAIRPWITERHVPFDGKLLLGLMTAYTVDPILNFYNHDFAMNAHSVSFGAWSNAIPGYGSPGQGRFAEGFLWAAPLYMYFGLLAAMIGGWVLARLRTRLRSASTVSLYAILFILFAVGDFAVEMPTIVLPQLYVFAGTPKAVTLFAGTVHQFPIYHAVLAAVYATMITWLRESLDGRGVSAAERGIERLAGGERVRGFVSYLAITGFATVAALSYFLPFAFLSMTADSYPVLPSYLRTAAYCGQPRLPECPSQYLHRLQAEQGPSANR